MIIYTHAFFSNLKLEGHFTLIPEERFLLEYEKLLPTPREDLYTSLSHTNLTYTERDFYEARVQEYIMPTEAYMLRIALQAQF